MVEAIIEAAARILESQGPERLTTNAVAEVAGVSIGSLYQYFPSKEALTAELIRRSAVVRETGIADAARTAEGASFDEGLRLLVRAAVEHQWRRPALERELDQQEQRLGIGSALQGEQPQGLAVECFLAAHRAELAISDVRTAADDARAIARALIDAAAARGDTDAAAIEERAVRAVSGYLKL